LNCRHCKTSLKNTFIDLGTAPPSNAYVKFEELNRPETYYPLMIKICHECWLVQTEDYAEAQSLFDSSYAYFSSTSTSWLKHAKDYSDMMIKKFKLNENSLIMEIASNDGYLLKIFLGKNIPCFGVEPTLSTAKISENLGIPVIKEFFSESLANSLVEKGKILDLVIGNNVYAHVPNINDFTKGLKRVLKSNGIITLEFPHLLELIKNNQFDTIYHEHFSYLSLSTVKRIFESEGLRIFDVEKLKTHGGSLRIYGCHFKHSQHTKHSVDKILFEESEMKMQDIEAYDNFQSTATRIKNDFIKFLIDMKNLGKCVVAYGAAAKGNTLLNFAGIKPDLLPVVFDAAKSKQNKFMPGSRIPILHPDKIKQIEIDYIIILPWNIKEEVIGQLKPIISKGCRFVTAVPKLEILK